jgi:drug/metabolite transporter (DMT)-like permease
MPAPTRLSAPAVLVLGVISIAWSAIFVRWSHMPAAASGFYRMLIASAVLWAILLLRRPGTMRIPRAVIPLAAFGGLCFAADVGLYNQAVLRTAAGSATFIGNNTPLLVGLLTWLVTRRLPSKTFWLAFFIATAGACLIVSVDRQRLQTGSTGDLLALAACFCFALYLISTERLRSATDTVTVIALSTTFSALGLFAFCLLAHSSLAIPGLRSLYALLGMAFVCQLCGYFCLTYALGHLAATVSSVVLLAVAPCTAILAFVFFHESMSPIQLVGGLLILIAVWAVSRPARATAASKMAQGI